MEVKKMKKVWIMFLLIIVLFFFNFNSDAIEEDREAEKHQRGTTAVGGFPANGFGLHDMAGNVREWVLDYYQTGYYLNSPAKNPQGPDIGRFRVIRGGSWLAGPGCVTVYRRNTLAANWVDFAVGFRCAKDTKPKKQEKNNE
jgi:formylglycine-generating enzyme required for sulfatase activity